MHGKKNVEYDTGDRKMDKKIKVLLADNSEHFGQPCAQVMRTHGLDVQTVQKDGKQVAEEIGRAHPDVVILDFFLPRMDAIGVMKNADSQGLTHKPQFMVMSSFDNPNLERKPCWPEPIIIFSSPLIPTRWPNALWPSTVSPLLRPSNGCR